MKVCSLKHLALLEIMSFLTQFHLSVKEKAIVEYWQWLLANEKLVCLLQPVSELKKLHFGKFYTLG